MISSLYTGASGVQTQSDSMTVTGSNIANVNTIGFKYNRVNFDDLMATSMAGDAKIGKGVKIGNVQNIQTQGSFEITEMETDLAIDGNGFFTVTDKNGTNYYTRAGQFTYDKDGYLTTQDGMFLQVRDVNPETNEATGEAKELKLLGEIDEPKMTGDGSKDDGVVLKANFDSNAKILTEPVNYDNVKADTYNYSTSVSVFDNKGNERAIQVAFRKLADQPPQIDPVTGQEIPNTETKNRWEWMVLVPGENLEGGLANTQKAVGGGFLEFSDDGRLIGKIPGLIQNELIPDPAGGPPTQGAPIMVEQPIIEGQPLQANINFRGSGLNQTIGFNFGEGVNPNDPNDNRSGLDGVTQFASEYTVHGISADGKPTGVLENIHITDNGDVKGNFSSGEVKVMGRLVLSDFNAPEKLLIQGESLYKETHNSGEAIQNDPGKGGLGTIHSKSLEHSNVELSTEFVKMIEGQRAFQANAKTVTTSDEILADLVQMKR